MCVHMHVFVTSCTIMPKFYGTISDETIISLCSNSDFPF